MERREEMVHQNGLQKIEAVKIFEYRKNNDGYWDEAKLYKQIVHKVLPIAEALYLRNSLFYLFDNITSHSVYTKNALQIKDINKRYRGKQSVLRDRWFN